ncbi:unnamed protein product [Sympodiomycopsis kandeliae]
MTPASLFTSLLALSLSGVQLSVSGAVTPAMTRRADTCNGHAELCDRLYSNVTYIGTHNSYAIGNGLSNIAANQAESITTQLNAGVRMLQAQVHQNGDTLELCHTSCSLLDGGSLENWLSEIKKWLDSNPNEVLSLLLVNSGNAAPSTFATVFDSTGMTSLMYSASSSGSVSSSGGIAKNNWPTLNSMISNGKRVVGYLASQGDISAVPYLLPEFSSMWENAYDQTTNSPFNCTIDRSGQGEDTSNQMYLANFFKANSLGSLGTVPDTSSIYTTNSESNLLQSAYNCASQHGNVAPTFILVDYYNYPKGDVFATAAQLNGLSYDNSTNSKSSSSSGSNGSTSGATFSYAPSAFLTLVGSTAIALAFGLA